MNRILSTIIVAVAFLAPIGLTIYTPQTKQADPIVTESAIQGQPEAEIGELVRLTASGEQVSWEILPKTPDSQVFGEHNENMVVSFRKSGVYTIIAAIVNGGGLSIETLEVQVGAQSTITPPVTPTDVPPTIQVTANQVVVDNILEWTSAASMDRATASDLAEVFQKVSNEIKSGNLVTTSGVISRTASLSNSLELGMYQGVLTNIQNLLTKLGDSGTLSSMEDHQQVWYSISEGFKQHAAIASPEKLGGAPEFTLKLGEKS